MSHTAISTLTVTLTLAALAAAPRAQGCLHFPDANAAQGPGSTQPFGETNPNDPNTANQALLFKIPRSRMPGQPVDICALGFVAEATRTRHLGLVKVRLGHSQLPQLDPLFSANMPGFTAVVIDAENWEWHTPADSWSFLGLDTSFPYDPARGDLVIQIIVGGGTSTGSGPLGFRSDPSVPSVLQRAWRFQVGRGTVGMGAPKVRVCWDAHDLQTFGPGCAGSNNLAPRLELTGSSALGARMTISLRDAPATSPGGVLMLGLRRRALPFDLSGFGATGCLVHPFFDIDVPTAARNGAADLPLTVPNNPNLACVSLWSQWVVVDPGANLLGITTSSFGRILFGR